ncbi:MAG: HNH endonuclease [Planctomycetota bacterium]|jgi:hypothetical protein
MAKRKSALGTVDAKTALEHFQDYLAPKLDVYEQAVYLYILRHTRLMGRPTVTVELKSARHKIARGLGKKAAPIAVRTCLEKLRSLDAKGCIKLVEEREDAPGVQVLVPSEIPGLISRGGRPKPPDLEEMDFFNVAANRRLILEREDGRCFYCLKKINDSSAVFDHVARKSMGDETYRNVVASCRRCNNRKGESGGEDLLRVLFREGFITSGLLADRLAAIDKLRAGELRPPIV